MDQAMHQPRATYPSDRGSAWSVSGLASGLGWFSIGLGLTELLAPRVITGPLGLHGRERLVRAFGAREIGAGIGLLTASEPSPWLWGRVAGDALDIATLAAGLRDNRRRPFAMLALAMLAGVTALDAYSANRARRAAAAGSVNLAVKVPEVERSITVGIPAAELLALLGQPDTMQRIAAPFVDVRPAGPDRTRWTLPGPLGTSSAWTARCVADEDGLGLRWEPEPGESGFLSPTFLSGVSLRLHATSHGTVVRLRVRFSSDAGVSGAVSRTLAGLVPAALLDKSLHFLKSLAETGEIPTTERQPAARADTR